MVRLPESRDDWTPLQREIGHQRSTLAAYFQGPWDPPDGLERAERATHHVAEAIEEHSGNAASNSWSAAASDALVGALAGALSARKNTTPVAEAEFLLLTALNDSEQILDLGPPTLNELGARAHTELAEATRLAARAADPNEIEAAFQRVAATAIAASVAAHPI